MEPPSASSVVAQPLPAVGDKVEALFYGTWYPAVVYSVQGDEVMVFWAGEHSRSTVHLTAVRPALAASSAELAPAEVLVIATTAVEDREKAGGTSPHLSAMSTGLDVPAEWEEWEDRLDPEKDADALPEADTPPSPPRRAESATRAPAEATPPARPLLGAWGRKAAQPPATPVVPAPRPQSSQAIAAGKPTAPVRAIASEPCVRDFIQRLGLSQRSEKLLGAQPKEVRDRTISNFIPQAGRNADDALQRYIVSKRLEHGFDWVEKADAATRKAFLKKWGLQDTHEAFLAMLPEKVQVDVMSRYTQLPSELAAKDPKFRVFARDRAVQMGYPEFAARTDGEAARRALTPVQSRRV